MIVLSFDLDAAGRPVIELFATPSAPRAEALREAGETTPKPVAIRALVDTGAGRSVIQRSFLRELDLDPMGTEWLNTTSSGASPIEAGVFAVQLFLAGVSGGMLATDLRVIEVEDLSKLGVGMLLGRDVIDRCLLFYSGQERRFTIAFEVLPA